MEAVHHHIAQDGTPPLAPEKTDLTEIGSERGSIDTRRDTVHAPILTGTKRRGVDIIYHFSLFLEKN